MSHERWFHNLFSLDCVKRILLFWKIWRWMDLHTFEVVSLSVTTRYCMRTLHTSQDYQRKLMKLSQIRIQRFVWLNVSLKDWFTKVAFHAGCGITEVMSPSSVHCSLFSDHSFLNVQNKDVLKQREVSFSLLSSSIHQIKSIHF